MKMTVLVTGAATDTNFFKMNLVSNIMVKRIDKGGL
ncbi:hypothetical protein J2Z22_002948 [Paenibacillus forsythiae]|uniref:Uncharacterized protein n=1 Tax=Paenibacillus forsythiae TaxID=365616 RepID=A0ABU3H9H7_9BACL|nr:hypothetical protein [Paenibacillus forsythiae]